MDLPALILAILGVIATLGGTAAYFKASAGESNRKLLESNISAYKDAEKLKDARIAYLEGQLIIKDETLKRLLNESK